MKQILKFLIAFIFLVPSELSAQFVKMSGYVKDKNTGEVLPSAYIFDSVSQRKTISDSYGYYTISIPKGTACFSVSYVGYREQDFSIRLANDTIIGFELNEEKQQIGEVVIKGNTPIHKQTLMGKTLLNKKDIINVPSFVGIPDLMKAITNLPGINQGSDGRSNIYVRGGDRGQNLILLDGAKLYNTNHFGGFVSLFNVDVIKHVDVYKSAFPSRFGGRLSSVIDISTLDGNRNRICGNFSLGLLNSSLAINGPLGNKFSFALGARSTYYDLFTLMAQSRYSKTNDDASFLAYTFFDINSKLTWYISTKHKVFISLYSGDDYNRSKGKDFWDNGSYEGVTKYTVKNASLVLGNRLLLNSNSIWVNSLIFSHYKNLLKTINKNTWQDNFLMSSYESSTSINEFSFHSLIQYHGIKNQDIKAGIEINNYRFLPGLFHISNQDNDKKQFVDTIFGKRDPVWASEISFYVEDELSLGKHFFTNFGMRGVLYSCNGKNYLMPEPRLSIRCMLHENLSLKTSYTLMNQFNHVLVSNFSYFEKETWIASTDKIPPQQASQFSIGVFSDFPLLKIDFSAEAYYKKMSNVIDYLAKGLDQENGDFDKMIVKNGRGEAYGFEFETKYHNKFISFDANYVLSWSYRQFQQLNSGQKYPFQYDRRHQFQFLLSYKINKSYSLNGTFKFASGRPFTVPNSYINSNNPENYNYYVISKINNYRMPNYHRLDLSLVKQKITNKNRIQKFALNVFNVYARRNAESVYFRNGKLYQFSLFTIVPTLAYSLEF